MSLERLSSLLDMFVEQLELACDKIGVRCIAGPSGHVNDIQAGVYSRADGCQLGNNESRCLRSRGYG